MIRRAIFISSARFETSAFAGQRSRDTIKFSPHITALRWASARMPRLHNRSPTFHRPGDVPGAPTVAGRDNLLATPCSVKSTSFQ